MPGWWGPPHWRFIGQHHMVAGTSDEGSSCPPGPVSARHEGQKRLPVEGLTSCGGEIVRHAARRSEMVPEQCESAPASLDTPVQTLGRTGGAVVLTAMGVGTHPDQPRQRPRDPNRAAIRATSSKGFHRVQWTMSGACVEVSRRDPRACRCALVARLYGAGFGALSIVTADRISG